MLPEWFDDDLGKDFSPVFDALPEESIERALLDRLLYRIAWAAYDFKHLSLRQQVEIKQLKHEAASLQLGDIRQDSQLSHYRDTINGLMSLLRQKLVDTSTRQQDTFITTEPAPPPSITIPQKRAREASPSHNPRHTGTTTLRRNARDAPNSRRSLNSKKSALGHKRGYRMRYRRWRLAPRYRKIDG